MIHPKNATWVVQLGSLGAVFGWGALVVGFQPNDYGCTAHILAVLAPIAIITYSHIDKASLCCIGASIGWVLCLAGSKLGPCSSQQCRN
eukprot:3913934-Amphidinium_carterae.1